MKTSFGTRVSQIEWALIIEKENVEVKLTSDVHNRPPYYLINRVVVCVHHDMFTYPTLYTCI